MLKYRQEQIQTFVRLADTLICIGAFFSAYWLRSSALLFEPGGIGPLDSLTWLLAASLAIHILVYPINGFYQSLRLKTISQLIAMILKTAVTEFFVLGSLVFFFQAKTTSRYYFGIFLALNYALVTVERLGARILLSAVRKRGYNYRQVLIAGEGSSARRVISVLRRNRHWGYVPCGILAERNQDPFTQLDEVPVLGVIGDLEHIIKSRAIDEVFFALDRFEANEISDQVALCERLGIPARFSLGVFELTNSKVTFANLDHLPVITFYTTLLTPAEAILKRSMDILIASVGLAILGILFPWIYWRIRRESPGPVIFKQVRVGENGRRFKCYKFRTMDLNAEMRKAELMNANIMDGPMFKMDNDPRITAFGALLRKTSLDELPQFFNILRGDMSVVGTRPPTPDEVSKYETDYRRRLSIRPGLTGLWQVNGRNNITRFEDVLALDLQYIDSWSIWLDIRIICKTVWVAVFRKGAH